MDKAKLWTNEGQPNNNQAFSRQKAALYATRILGFPLGEAVGFCRLKRSLQGGEGQPNNNLAFFQKAALYSTRILGFPRRGSCRLSPTEEVFACLPSIVRLPNFSSAIQPRQHLFFPRALRPAPSGAQRSVHPPYQLYPAVFFIKIVFVHTAPLQFFPDFFSEAVLACGNSFVCCRTFF